MFVRISGIRAQIFLETENIRDINICLGSGLYDGDGQTTESDSSDEDDEEYHTASPAEMCLKVGKENIKVTVTHCMNNEERMKQQRRRTRDMGH